MNNEQQLLGQGSTTHVDGRSVLSLLTNKL